MIKFFRNIRQNLIMKNNTGKYLKYAIGEIVLVVIGILIAIQANNWNIDRIAQKEKEFALHKLIENLNQDISNLQSGIDSGKQFITALDSCLIILKNPRDYSKDYFSGLFSYMNYTLPFEYNQITFNEMSNSGKLKLIKNEALVDSLFHYYDSNNYIAVSDALNLHTRETIRSYTMGYDFMVLPHVFDTYSESEFNIKPKSLTDYNSDVHIINSIRFKILLLKSLTERYGEMVQSASNLITLTNEEIKFN